MLEKFHAGHLGVEMNSRRARDTLYWRGTNGQTEKNDIKMYMFNPPQTSIIK